ncbi:TRAP transporter small permease subunit [Phascolarctobacterium sp.]|uniref:TRAP transporter small permease subunit n=1 Tax=Phascolarctobacterium sp. TaxID=2049039 RepID=UPI0025DBD85B|nr:TRAP transporter small permease [uncultured Phascolarctobacterium sp.]
MKSAIEIYGKILDAVTKIVAVIAGILILMPALMVFYEVVMRGLFNAPTEWSIELSVYCVLIAGFLGMSVTYAAGKHIHVDIVVGSLSPRTRCFIEVFTTCVGIFFCAVFVMESFDMAMLSLEMDNTSPSTLRTPMWIPQMALPIGMGLLLLQFVRTLLVDIEKINTGDFSKEVK